MIFPEEYPKLTRDLSSEKLFHSRFKKELGREFTVYYSVRLSTPDVPMREIDFLVISPRMILCIELKNGKWRYRDSKWEFYNRREKIWEEHKNKPYHGPVEQVRSAKQILKDFLYNHNSFSDPVSDDYFQSSVFFLKNDPSDFPISDREKENFIGKSKLKDSHLTMQDILTELQNHKLPPLSNDTIKNLHNIIRLNLNFATDINSKKKSQNTQLISLTLEQFEILKKQENIPRTIVLGVTGSGKTVVATEYAFRLEAAETITLFITAHSATAKTLANLVRWFSVDFATPNTIIDYANEYDFVILDSCETYLTKEFIQKHSSIIKGGWEKGRWLALGDWNASLQKREFREGLDQFRIYSSQEVVWKNNIRTPQIIYEQARVLGRRDNHYPPSKLQDITGVQYVSYIDEEEFYKKLDWAIFYGVRDLGILRSDIVIISLDEILTKEVLHKTSDRTQKGHVIFPYWDSDTNLSLLETEIEERVSIVDLKDFRGREAAYVIIVGISDFNDIDRYDDYFDAMTRSNAACTILYPEKLEPQLTELFQSQNMD